MGRVWHIRHCRHCAWVRKNTTAQPSSCTNEHASGELNEHTCGSVSNWTKTLLVTVNNDSAKQRKMPLFCAEILVRFSKRGPAARPSWSVPRMRCTACGRGKNRRSKAAKQLGGPEAAKEEAEKCKSAVHLFTVEGQQLRDVHVRLKKSVRIQHFLIRKLYEARADIQSCPVLLQRAPDLRRSSPTRRA